MYPDLTVNHLLSLDNRTLRDNAFIANNTAVRINAFVSRQLVMCGFPERWYKRLSRSSTSSWSCEDGDTRLPYVKNFDPNDVMERLGKITLIGQQVQYLNRVGVVQGEVKAGSIGTPLLLTEQIEVEEGSADLSKALNGINLQGATVSTERPEIVKLSSQQASPDGTSLSFKVTLVNALADTSYRLYVNSPHGSTTAMLTVTKKAKTTGP